METVRVLVADDHPVFREGLRAVLDCIPWVEVVGEVGDGLAAVAAAESLAPDVVVMDLHMPRANGVEATREIVRARPTTGVLVLTMFEDDESVLAAMRAGARGYLLKESSHADIVRALEAVAGGGAIFGPSIAGRVIGQFSGAGRPAQPFPQLTEREREVLELLAAGHSNQAIAKHLYVSGKTVRNHVSNVFSKLGVADRAQAIVRAREAGIGGGPPA